MNMRGSLAMKVRVSGCTSEHETAVWEGSARRVGGLGRVIVAAACCDDEAERCTRGKNLAGRHGGGSPGLLADRETVADTLGTVEPNGEAFICR